MRTSIISAAIMMGLAGCVGMRSPSIYGNFSQVAVPSADRKMASDAILKLEVLYPPARTRIDLLQKTTDPFGMALVEGLRSRGYALSEFYERRSDIKAVGGPRSQPVLALAYVVDQPLDAGIYRVTILVDRQSLSRIYLAKDGAVEPAGYWAHKE